MGPRTLLLLIQWFREGIDLENGSKQFKNLLQKALLYIYSYRTIRDLCGRLPKWSRNVCFPFFFKRSSTSNRGGKVWVSKTNLSNLLGKISRSGAFRGLKGRYFNILNPFRLISFATILSYSPRRLSLKLEWCERLLESFARLSQNQ